MEAKERIIVALDVNNVDEAKNLVTDLAPHVGCFKVGLELISSGLALEIIDFIHSVDGKVFYDGKFCDIPNTVGAASKSVAEKRVRMFNVHASSGVEAMMSAVRNRVDSLVLAVTVLTSLEENNANLIFGGPVKAKVLQFARDAKIAGCDGIICSPEEIGLIEKQKELKELLKIVPGVRPKWAPTNDQKRFMTPAEAIKAGANFIVVGRPITRPPGNIRSPLTAVEMIAEEINLALQGVE